LILKQSPLCSGSTGSGSSWGISSIFSASDTRSGNGSSKEHVLNRGYAEPAQAPMEYSFASIQLREVSIQLSFSECVSPLIGHYGLAEGPASFLEFFFVLFFCFFVFSQCHL
jgi:hypothetical protein